MAFSQAIQEAVLDDGLRQSRIENGLKTAEQFRWEQVANAFLGLYEDMLRPIEVSDSSGEEGTRFQPDLVSTPPDSGPSTLARITATVFQRVLACR